MQSDHDDIPQDVRLLADEINRYLREREFVADTLEGISRWWILRQRLQEERRRVEQAMEYLCAQGVVEMRTLPDGEVLYSPTSLKKDTVTKDIVTSDTTEKATAKDVQKNITTSAEKDTKK